MQSEVLENLPETAKGNIEWVPFCHLDGGANGGENSQLGTQLMDVFPHKHRFCPTTNHS